MSKRMKKKPKNWINTQKGVVKTKDALNHEDRIMLLAAAKKLGRVQGFDAWRVCMVFMYTGMHTSVLSNAAKSRVRVIDGVRIQWLRPKKKGSPAVTEIPLHPDLMPWIEEFIHSPELKRARQAYHLVVQKCGIAAGLEGISPMSLRHTFAVMLDEWGFTSAEMCLLLNCSPRTLMRYTRRTRKVVEEKLGKRGWGIKESERVEERDIKTLRSPRDLPQMRGFHLGKPT